jgi:hypothetical protein
LRKDGKVLKDDGSYSKNEDDCDDGGVRVHEADAHVPPEDLLWNTKADREKRKQRDEIKYGEYRNCDFILGSGA